MPRAQCYYEILGISETATSDDIKKAYRNLALVWHPDKNQTNAEEAHAKFQSILKAYETLSDSRERDWYDRHKDQILSDGDKSELETCINLFQYFSSSCYANLNDDEDGFYTVYRTVFKTIADEEEQASSARKGPTFSYPMFGDSNSDYDEIVRPFYAYWSGFCTNLSFDHLDKYKTTEAENRRILRAMEKENKKVKDAARKDRNTNVRNLVEFIKKRDKRLKVHRKLVEEQNEIKRQKTAEKHRKQREKCLQENSEYKPTAWEDMDEIEKQLRQLEDEYDNVNSRNPDTSDSKSAENEDGDEVENEDEEGEDDEEESFFCPACNKDFKSIKAFENHEMSKKHKQNVVKLTKLLKDEEKKLNK